jgi:predicted aspartyl protease
MGTPRKKFTICGIDACDSVEALLDTGADMTLLSRELAEKVGAFALQEKIPMKSATGQNFLVQQAIVEGNLGGECGGSLIVGITDRKNLGGEDAIVGNDLMGQKCMTIKFGHEECGLPQLVRVWCGCRDFLTK